MFFKILSSVLLFHIFMSNYYPDEETKLIMNLTYYCIYAYTFIEMKVKQLYLQIINDNPSLLEFAKHIFRKTPDDNIEIISGNQVINTCNKENAHLYITDYCKFIIYSESQEQTTRINKMIIHNTEGIKNNSFKYTLCNYMFISVEIYIHNELKQLNYDLNFFFNGNNYYIANNKIDKYVICFLLYSRHGIYQKPETCKYKLNIIDQSANMFHLCEKDVLHLYEDNYEVIQVIGHVDDLELEKKNIISDEESVRSEDNSNDEKSSDESYEKIKEE